MNTKNTKEYKRKWNGMKKIIIIKISTRKETGKLQKERNEMKIRNSIGLIVPS